VLGLAGEEEFVPVKRYLRVGSGEKLWRQWGDHGRRRTFSPEAQAHKPAAERKAPRGIACCEYRCMNKGDVYGSLKRTHDDRFSGPPGALREGRHLVQGAQGYTQTCTYDFPDDVHKGLRAGGTVRPARSFKLLIVGR